MNMNTKRIKCIAATLVAFSMASSPVVAAPQQTNNIVTVADCDNNKTIDLTVGDTLVLRLASNSSTGYSWRVAQNNERLLQPQGEPAYESSASNLPCAQGTQVSTFTAAAAGGDALNLLYQRPNAGQHAPVTFVCAGTANFTVLFGDKIATVTCAGTTKQLPQAQAADGFHYVKVCAEGAGSTAYRMTMTVEPLAG
jgi:predicted secreted protein